MKMLYKGITTGKLKTGQTVEAEIIKKNTVWCQGDGFVYTFKYDKREDLEQNWEGVERK